MNEIKKAKKPLARTGSGRIVRNEVRDVLRLLKPFLAAYPQIKATEEMMAAWIDSLRDIPIDALERGLAIVREQYEWPTIAAIRLHCNEEPNRPQLDLTMEEIAELPERNFTRSYRESERERRERIRRIYRHQYLWGDEVKRQ